MYLLDTRTVPPCQDRLHVSRTHDVVHACDKDGGYRAVCDRRDQHRRTIGRHGWSARGNAAGLSRPGLCVPGPRSRFHFHFFERGCKPRSEQRYGDLSHGLCSDRPTTLDVAQHILAFAMWLAAVLVLSPVQWTAWSASALNVVVFTACTFMVQPFGLTHPPTKRPWYDFVLRAGLVAALVGVVVTLSSQIGPRGSGVLAVFPVIYASIMLILHRRIGGPATAAVLATLFPLLPDLAWPCSPCISPQCRLDPVQPSSSPLPFPSFGMRPFMQYVAAKLD